MFLLEYTEVVVAYQGDPEDEGAEDEVEGKEPFTPLPQVLNLLRYQVNTAAEYVGKKVVPSRRNR